MVHTRRKSKDSLEDLIAKRDALQEEADNLSREIIDREESEGDDDGWDISQVKWTTKKKKGK